VGEVEFWRCGLWWVLVSLRDGEMGGHVGVITYIDFYVNYF